MVYGFNSMEQFAGIYGQVMLTGCNNEQRIVMNELKTTGKCIRSKITFLPVEKAVDRPVDIEHILAANKPPRADT